MQAAMILIVLSAVKAAGNPVYTNEPAGAQTILDEPFDSIPTTGWSFSANPDISIVADQNVPGGPSSVLEEDFPVGFTGGASNGILEYAFNYSGPIFMGYMVKMSDPFQILPNLIQKEVFLWATPGAAALWYFTAYGGGPPFEYQPRISTSILCNDYLYPLVETAGCPDSADFHPNVNNIPFNLGQWYRIEVCLQQSTTQTSRDGILKWWINGTLAGDFEGATGINTQTEPWASFQISPTWGGIGGTKTENDYIRFDQVHLSRVPNCGSAPPPGNQVSPAAPTGLNVR